MKKITIFVLGLFLVLFVTSCAPAHAPVYGYWYTNVKGPLDAEQGSGASEGKACASSILSLVAMGDASIEAAKSNGGISEVSTVDTTYMNILWLYARACTIVKGK